MRAFRLFATVLTAFILAGSAVGFAQADKKPAGVAQPDMEKYMQMAQPGPEHQSLAKLVGKWKAVNKMWMDPASPPMETTGTVEYVSMLGGRYIEGHYHSTVMGQPFEGLSVDGYDRYKKEFISFWFDTMGTGYIRMTGAPSADGKTTNLKGTMFEPMSGKDMPVRSVATWVDANTIRYEMFGTRDGKETKSMEITYTRQ